jgi:hypothetical protein
MSDDVTVEGPGERLSVPPRILTTPRRLDDDEWATLLAIADTLIPAVGDNPAASQAPDYASWLRRALAARAEHFELLVEQLHALAGLRGAELDDALRRASTVQPQAFQVVSAVVAGAYLMVPQVRGLVGYPGQVRSVPRLEEAAEQLDDGILDPVIERGPTYVSAAGE